MSLRSTATFGETPTYRQPTIRSKVWGFEPFWKFVNYDVELSSNSSTSSNGKPNFDDDFYFVAGISPTEKSADFFGGFSNKKSESSKVVERIIPIQRVRTTSMTIPPPKTATLAKPMPTPTPTPTPTVANKDSKMAADNKAAEKISEDRQQKLLADISNFNKGTSIGKAKTTDDLFNHQKKNSSAKVFDDSSVFHQKKADDRTSTTLTRRSPPRDTNKKAEDHFRKASTLERRPKANPNGYTSRYQSHTLPMKIPSEPSATFYLGPKFESLPSSLEVQKPPQLTSVLKKPGAGKSDRKSLKKVAFLESSY